MAFSDGDGGSGGIQGQTVTTTDVTKWYDVGKNINYYIDLTVENLSGTNPVHQWSIEHCDNPDNLSGLATLFADNTFTDVDGTSLPNTQRKLIAETGNATSSKKYIRAKWTLTGTTPVSTVSVSINKVKYGLF